MTTETTIPCGYILTESGDIYVQVPNPESRWGFYLADDDQSWDGGIGLASSWELLDEDDPRITDDDRERLEWILEEHQ
ncbi:MAG: hypothetical protein AB7G11_02470 [Phycisphaerales bacterium]